MPLASGTIPNFIQGVSQQPQELRTVTQLDSQVNCYSSPVEGLTNRPPIEHIAKVSATPLDTSFLHTINRSASQRYKLAVSSGFLEVFDLAGNSKTINFFDETLILCTGIVAAGTQQVWTIAAAPGETAVDFSVTGITTATVTLQGSPDNIVWTDLSTRTTNGENAGVSIVGYKYMRVNVSAYTSGTIKATATYKNCRYLLTATPQSDIRAVTVADYTFLINKTKVTAMQSDTSPASTHEGLVFIKRGDYGTKYEIFINGSSAASYTTSSTDPTTLPPDYIAAQLVTALVAASYNTGNWTTTRSGSVIHIVNSATDFTLQINDGQGGNDGYVIKDQIQNFTLLPATAPDGFEVTISQNPSNPDSEKYYVTAHSNQSGATFGPVSWEESIGAGLKYIIDPMTMPYTLIHNDDDTFDYTQASWNQRVCGDDNTNPVPSFIGTTINDVYFYKNRLGLLADENFIQSEVANYFNFFRTTVTQILDSDPVDSSAKSQRVSILQNAIEFNKSMVLFSDQTQFSLPGDTALTIKTVRCDVVSQYESLVNVRPVQAGKVIYFLFNRQDASGQGTGFVGLKELFVSPYNPDLMEAEEITAHTPSYIPAGAFSMSVSTLENVVAILTTGDPTSVYLYKTDYQNEKKVQSAVFRWDLSQYTASTTKVLSADFIASTLYLLVQRNGEVFLEKMQLLPNRTDSYANYVTLLDRRIDDSQLLSAVYDGTANQTTLTLPFNILSTQMDVATRSVADNSPYDIIGRELTIVSATVGGNTVVVKGDYSVNPLWIGQRYNCTAGLSTIYIRKQLPGGGLAIDSASKLQLLRGFLVYSQSGSFNVSVTPLGRPVSTYQFNGRIIGDINNVIGQVALRSGRFPFAILANNEQVTIVINSNAIFRFRITSMAWEGTFTKRSVGM